MVTTLLAVAVVNIALHSASSEPRGANCGSSSFPYGYNNVEVVGLNGAPGHAGRSNATACMMQCCSYPECTVWQWSPTGTRVSPPIAGCNIGRSGGNVFDSPGWVGAGTKAAPPPSPAPPPKPPPPPAPPPPPTLPKTLVSNTLGSHMVLQRAPASSIIYGYAAPGTIVSTSLDGAPALKATADSTGTWRQALPPTEADGKAHAITVASSATPSMAAETVALTDVVFGDVFVCGGQSNMAFAVDQMTNGTTSEAALANKYSGLQGIRLFTVGQGTPFQNGSTPADHLLTLEQRWVAASNTTVRDVRPGNRAFTYFSAVCWIFGRTVHDGLGGTVPVGLVSSNWPGTRVEEWVSLTPGVEKCTEGHPVVLKNYLYNSMIHPFTVGPMAVTGFTWYQGESNVGPVNTSTGVNDAAAMYSCTFTELIKGWRQAFQVPDAFFGFVQLSTWCGDVLGIPDMRGQIFPGSHTQGQMAALELPNVGYATNADHGMGCGIHPVWKQYVGERLGNSALGITYKKADINWKSPYYMSAKIVADSNTASQPFANGSSIAIKIAKEETSAAPTASLAQISVLVTLAEVGEGGLTTDVFPYNYIPFKGSTQCSALGTSVVPGTCGWASIKVGNAWLNATMTQSGGKGLLLTVEAATLRQSGASPTATAAATAYAWAPVPLMNAYDVTSGLPVLPWNRSL